ncbi:MAG TPA: hypothetical protein PLG79_05665 [Spirochaetales bacterium]|nr:hypothetical protein [Spirochaetales bacterium]
MMREKISQGLFLFGLFFCILFNLEGEPFNLKPLEYLIQEGKREEALPLIEELLTHQPTSSDLLFLKARALPYDVEALQKAIQNKNWQIYQEEPAIFLLATRLLQRKQAVQTLELLQGLTVKGEAFPEYYYLMVQTYHLLAEGEKAAEFLQKGMSLFPKDPRFLKLYFRIRGRATPGDSALWDGVDSADPAYLDALVEYIEVLQDPEQKKLLAKEYFQRGGRDPRVYCALLEANGENLQEAWEGFKATGGLQRLELWERLFKKFTEGEPQKILQDELNSYTGWMARDRELDKYDEEHRRFLEGKLTFLSLDANQDGVIEIEADFLFEKPHRLRILLSSNEEREVFFSEYPQVERILIEQDTCRWEYRYGFQELSWKEGFFPLQTTVIPKGIVSIETDSIEPFLILALQKAFPYQKIEICNGGKRICKTLLSRGVIVYFQEEQEIQPGKSRKRAVSFSQGIPVYGFVDLDGDGYFDLKETYREGALEYVELVPQGSYPIYREYLEKQMKEWDFNRDGKIDAREYRSGRSTVVREFSSLLDGLFDIRAWEKK